MPQRFTHRSVRIDPGAMALARMPSWAYWPARVFVNETMPPLAAA